MGDPVVAHPAVVLSTKLRSTTEPTAAFKVAALADTETIGYHPGIQLVPLLMNNQAPTSDAVKLYEALVNTGDDPVADVAAPSAAILPFVGSKNPPLAVSWPVLCTS